MKYASWESKENQRMRSLSDEDLKEEIMWSQINARVRQIEKRYPEQSNSEQLDEYNTLHAIYRRYWDEAYRRKLVDKSSDQLEKETIKTGSAPTLH